MFSNHKVTSVKPKATLLKLLPFLGWHWLTSAGGTFVSATAGTFQSDEPGTFVPATGGTFVPDIPGTFESDTGGTFNPLLSALSLLDVEFNLGEDYIHAKTRNSFIADMSKKQMIKYAAENEHLEDTIAKSEKMHKRYQELASKFDFEAYIPLIPWTRKKTMKVLETMDELISSELVHLYGDYRFCFDFTLLSSPASKEEQQMVIGDPDEFYDHVVQENKDYQDLIAYNLNSLADLIESLSPKMKGTVSKMHLDLLSRMPFSIRDAYLRDAVIRDVRTERAAEVEKELETEEDEHDDETE